LASHHGSFLSKELTHEIIEEAEVTQEDAAKFHLLICTVLQNGSSGLEAPPTKRKIKVEAVTPEAKVKVRAVEASKAAGKYMREIKCWETACEKSTHVGGMMNALVQLHDKVQTSFDRCSAVALAPDEVTATEVVAVAALCEELEKFTNTTKVTIANLRKSLANETAITGQTFTFPTKVQREAKSPGHLM
jgi:hypothetical protein